MKKIVVVGAGFSGSILARKIAEELGRKVTIIERRSHIGGNAYDELDEHGILIQKYGPHFLNTNHYEVIRFLKQYGTLHQHNTKLLSFIDGNYIQHYSRLYKNSYYCGFSLQGGAYYYDVCLSFLFRFVLFPLIPHCRRNGSPSAPHYPADRPRNGAADLRYGSGLSPGHEADSRGKAGYGHCALAPQCHVRGLFSYFTGKRRGRKLPAVSRAPGPPSRVLRYRICKPALQDSR